MDSSPSVLGDIFDFQCCRYEFFHVNLIRSVHRGQLHNRPNFQWIPSIVLRISDASLLRVTLCQSPYDCLKKSRHITDGHPCDALAVNLPSYLSRHELPKSFSHHSWATRAGRPSRSCIPACALLHDDRDGCNWQRGYIWKAER